MAELKPVYTFEIFDQSGAVCYEINSWRMLEPAFFTPFIDLDDFPHLRGVRIHGGSEDGWLYTLYGSGVYHSRNWFWKLDPSSLKPRYGVKLVGGTDARGG